MRTFIPLCAARFGTKQQKIIVRQGGKNDAQTYQSHLLDRCGGNRTGTGAHIAARAQERYEELCRENISDSKTLRAHTYARIYPGIAVYEALRADGIGQEQAVWLIREYFQHFSARFVPHLQRAIKNLGLAKWIPGLFMKISLQSFGPDAGFGYAFPESHGREARFNIVKCPYYETCLRYGCPEITRAFCDGDDAGYGNLHPKLIWGRTKTIGRGGDCCDFLLTYKEN